MTCSELLDRLNLLVNLSAALLGVSVTLVALVPTLIQLARVSAPDFFSRLDREGSLKRVMVVLAVTVMLFSISLGASWVGIFFPIELWFWIGLVAFSASLIVLVSTSILVAFTTRDVM
jgi:hypothetical protein